MRQKFCNKIRAHHMATLIYSDKCKYCYEIIEFIKTRPALHSVIQYHHVNQGVPDGVTKVPSLITTSGQLYSGKQVREYLDILAPVKLEKFTLSKSNLVHKNLFQVSNYGANSNKPVMTPELERKINQSVSEGLQNLKR